MIKNPGEISLQESLDICHESIKKAREMNFMPITVTVVDVAGVIRATLAEDGSGLTRADVAYAKAWSCIAAGFSTSTLRDIIEEQPRLDKAINGMQILANGKLMPTPGGLIIQSDEDEICAIAGIEAAGLEYCHNTIK